MGKRETQILIKKIISSLMNSSSKSISEISEETNIDRTVIPKYLKTLQECGILIEEKKGMQL